MSIAAEVQALCPRLRRYALRLTRNLDDSEDLLQDTLERALRFQHQFNGQYLFAWLTTIMRSRFFPARRRHREVSIEAVRGGAHESAVGGADAGSCLAGDEFLEPSYPCRAQHYCALFDMQHALSRLLTPEQLEAVWLHRVDGLDYLGIAAHQRVALGTVKSRIHRAEEILASRCGV